MPRSLCVQGKKCTAFNPTTFLYFYIIVQQDDESDEQGTDLRQSIKGVDRSVHVYMSQKWLAYDS